MSQVEQLITRPVRTAAKNREMLVERARHDCAAFGVDLDFDRHDWNVTAYCPRPAGKAGQKAMLYFTTHENGSLKGIEGRTPLPEPFCSVLKALVRLKKDGNPKIVDLPLSRMIIAARYLIPLLKDRGYDPCRLIPHDFDEACNEIRARGGSPSTHYRIGQSLAEISRELNRYNITLFPFTWANTFRRVANDTRIGVKAEEAGRKIPEQQVLNELARISHLVTTESDRVLMAAVKLMHCAPWRVGEAILLKKWKRLKHLENDRRGLKRSEHLFLVNEHLHNYRGTNPCALDMTTDQHISDFLCGRGSTKGRVKSVFERFDSVDDNGNPLRINTHDFRHWLNTLVQQHGADQAIVAKWSGRTDTLLIEWPSVQEEPRILADLDELGIPARLAARLFAIYAGNTVEQIRADPYRMLAIANWTVVDPIACQIGVLPDDPRRISAAIEHSLHEMLEQGDTLGPSQRAAST